MPRLLRRAHPKATQPALIEAVERRMLFAITLSGSPTPVGSINTATSADFTLTAIGTSGNSLIAFPNANKLFGRIVTSAGVPVGNEFQISGTGQSVPKFTGFDSITDAGGNVFVSYSVSNASNTDFGEIFVVKLDATGNQLLAPFNVSNLPMSQSRPSLALAGSILGVAFDGVTSNFGRNSAIYFATYNASTGAVISAATNVSVPQDPLPGGGTLDRSPSLVYSSLADQFTLVNLRQTFNAQNNFQGQELDARTISTSGVASAQVTVFAEPGNNVTLGIPRAISTSAGVGLFYSRTTFAPENLLSYQSSAIISNFLGNDATPDAAPVTLKSAAAPAQIGLADVTSIPLAPVPGGVRPLSGTDDPDLAVCTAEGSNDFNAGGLVSTSSHILTTAAKSGTVAADDACAATEGDPEVRFTGPEGLIVCTSDSDGTSTTTVNVTPATYANVVNALSAEDGVYRSPIIRIVDFRIALAQPATADITFRVKTKNIESPTAARPDVDYDVYDQPFTIRKDATEALAFIQLQGSGAGFEPGTGRILTIEVTDVTGPATLVKPTGTFTLPESLEATQGCPFEFTAIASPPAPGSTVNAKVTLRNTSTPQRPAPSGSGKFRGTITFPGLSPIQLFEIPLKFNLKPGTSRVVPLKIKLPAPLPTGTGTLAVAFTADPGSALKTSDILPSIASGSETLTVTNKFSNGTTLVAGDADGTLAVFSLKGPGTGELVKNPDGSTDLVLTGTTATTKVTVKLSPVQPAGNEGRFNVRNITSNSAIGSVDAPNIDTAGNITLGGPITKGTFGQVKDDHLITLAAGSIPATLSFINLQNVTFTSGQPIKSLTLNSWLDTDATPDTLSAPSIAALIVKGHLQSSLTLTGALGTAIIGGDFTGSLSASSIKSLTVKSVLGSPLPASPSRVFATTSIGKVSAGAARNLFFSAGTLTGLTTLPTSSADFLSTPSSIAAFSITGIPGQSSLFSNTILAARTLGPVQIKGLTPTSPTTPPTPFGIRALSIASYTQGTTKAKKTTAPTTLDTSSDFSAATLG